MCVCLFVLLQPITLYLEGEEEDKQHNHLFSISSCTLHTRSRAWVRICLMLWCSAISERTKGEQAGSVLLTGTRVSEINLSRVGGIGL